jgi:hypothetical protein
LKKTFVMAVFIDWEFATFRLIMSRGSSQQKLANPPENSLQPKLWHARSPQLIRWTDSLARFLNRHRRLLVCQASFIIYGNWFSSDFCNQATATDEFVKA